MKKLISFILAVLMLFPLCSCNKEAKEKQSSEKETLLSGSLENGGRWFYGEMSYSGIVVPLKGTYEKERTNTVYLNDILTDGTTRDFFSPGTVVKVEYDGELFLPSGHAVPIISNLYSISFGVYPLESKEGKFTVACTQSSFDYSISEKIYSGESNGVFKAESSEEFFELYLQTRPSYNDLPNYNDEKATAASGSASAAATSETNAKASETAAAGSASAAATSASDAAKAQAAAEAAQAAAEASNTSATAIANEAKANAATAVGTANEAKATADKAIQDVANVANNGLILSKSADNKVSVDWDPNVVFVFNCGSATELVD